MALGELAEREMVSGNRELLGFIWAIGTRAETIANQRIAA
jgi:hypothetical protein